MSEREKVYLLIDGEREYQNSQPPRPKSDADTSVGEWLNYIEFQLNEAKVAVYYLDEPKALSHIRKLTALGVVCMENNWTPARHEPNVPMAAKDDPSPKGHHG